MSKLIVFTCVLAISIHLIGCHNPPEKKDKKNQSITSNNAASKNHLNNTNLPCKTSSPPIKDKVKLKKMLIDNGTITVEMSEEMANKTVDEYIKKKQEAFKRCTK